MPPPSTASGYHTQFRRGILVPVYSSFQSQLSAIAKEYALPSTAGLILYLINNSPQSPPSGLSQKSEALDETVDKPGPRISDDIWRHIWTRVIQVEQRDDILPSPSFNPGLNSLKTGLASRSTPQLLDTTPLRPFVSTPTPDVPPLPSTSPSTPSTAFSQSKYVADSSPEDPETPDTSTPSNAFDAQQRAQSLDLPGLRSPSLIPILAKVEFDIDRRKAVWYEPWLRTRKANHAKRTESRGGRKGSSEEGAEGQERQPPIQLIIGRQQTASPMSVLKQEDANDSGYQQLSESGEMEDEGGNSDEGETDQVALVNGKDPLADVFGTDADTWAGIHAANGEKQSSNPNVVNLALTAAGLGALPSDSFQEPRSPLPPEEEEVRDLLNQMSRPVSSSTATGVLTSPTSKHSSSSTHTAKKPVPPPLVLVPKDPANDLVVPSEPSPMPSTPGSIGLAYLNGDSSPEKSSEQEYVEDEFDDQYAPVRSSSESEKRAGTIYDDLDLGLDPADDFDENDPNDRRRSQFLLKAKLDEIERTMAQLSPRMLDADLDGDSITSTSYSPKTPNYIPVSPGPGMLNADYYPPSPSTRAPLNLERTSVLNHPSPVQGPPRSSSANATSNIGQASWPAVPFSSIRNDPGISNQPDGSPSPPQLAVNGVTTSALKSFVPQPANVVSAETERRKRELEEEFPVLANTSSPIPEHAAEDQVIPLSPDPFGRYPSSTPSEPTSIDAHLSDSSSQQWDTVTVGRGSTSLEPVAEDDDETPGALASQGRSRSATTSRFSADSATIGDEGASTKPSMKTTLMTVRSIKKLWRKSNNKSSNTNNIPTSTPAGRNSPQAPPVRPERPSEETMDLPDVEHPLPNPPPNFKGYSPQPNSPHPQPPLRMSQDQYRSMRTSQDQYSSSRPSYDQTNPANTHVPQNLNVPQSKQGLQVPHSPNQGVFPPIPTSTPPPNHPQGLMVPPQNHSGGLNLPAYVGRSANVSPIIAAQMLPRGGSSMNRLQFDQESPYPVHSPRYSPRAVSPPSLPPAQVPLPPSPAVPTSIPAQQAQQQQQSLPSLVSEKEKLTGRKSILKAFQKSKQTPALPPTPTEPRSSIDKLSQSPGIGRPRRPSFHSTKSSMTSVNDIPPSPHIPEQFLVGGGGPKNGATLGTMNSGDSSVKQSRLTTSSTDSAISQRQHLGRSGSPPPLSMASSRSSQETRPSFDTSQFEIVSPKASTLTYPYHNLDHQ